MGDRNPIKFGPAWLRNLSRDRGLDNQGSPTASSTVDVSTSSAGASTSSGTTHLSSAAGATGGDASSGSSATTGTSSAQVTGATPKIKLAKLRYGREEMLALYDRNSDAPAELKVLDFLYQRRGKTPSALNNNFEDEMIGNTVRSGAPGTSGERFGVLRGMSRAPNSSERGRSRPFIRQPSGGRGNWHGGPRMPLSNPRLFLERNYLPDEETSPQRPWNASNGGNTPNRNSGEQGEWSTKLFRKRLAPSNWRQAREEGDEWRSHDGGRGRSATQQDRWERDWGDRQSSQTWTSNRRPWAGSESHNNDELPEWAVENAEAGGGSFDSTGAFHGFSNDDTNIPPKTQEASFPLARSRTHGSFARSKSAVDESDGWWASEKANKLSPKRFDASDIKFKKSNSITEPLNMGAMSSALDEIPTQDHPTHPTDPDPKPEASSTNDSEKKIGLKSKFGESVTFDALMRSDINLEEATDERGNFQSVIITPNNSLRQKHQNIVSVLHSTSTDSCNTKPKLFHILPENPAGHYTESDYESIKSNDDVYVIERFMDMTMEDEDLDLEAFEGPPSLIMSKAASLNTAMPSVMPQMPNPGMHMQIPMLPGDHMQSGLMNNPNMPAGMPGPGMPGPPIQPPPYQVGITNSALNASLGLPIGPPGAQALPLPMQGMPQPILNNPGMQNPGLAGLKLPEGLGGNPMQGNNNPGRSEFPNIQGLSTSPSSLFLNQNPGNNQMANHGNMFPMHGMQQPSQPPFGNSIYGNMMPPNTPRLPGPPRNPPNYADQWFYEDPKKIIQGPFTSMEMYNWYRAGFFSPSLMVRRACDTSMRPLGSYGNVMPFDQVNMNPFQMSPSFERPQGPRDMMMNPQSGMGLESVDNMWSPGTQNPDMMWMPPPMNVRNDNRVNNLPVYFWDQQPSAMSSSTLLPEEIVKEMKTEDQILAQIRASQNIPLPNMEDLQKLIQKDILVPKPDVEPAKDNELQVKQEKTLKEQTVLEPNAKSQQQPTPNKTSLDVKAAKQTKNENEKAKTKENTNKTKAKKAKEDKKDEIENMKEEEIVKVEKRSQESSPSKSKKEDKLNKKDLEKEKKEWIKEGFTIVKSAEKNNNKETKKKAEEAKATEEAERKRREEDKLAAEEEKKRKQLEALKLQEQQQQEQQQRQVAESVAKKAPWSAVANQNLQATTKDGMTLAEIQRLEREKKLEQMKEQQQMMQIIAQQQAAALAREQEMQAGLGWAKKKGANTLNMPGQSLSEIQAEARKQQVAAAAVAAATAAANQAIEEAQAAQQAQMNVPWGTPHNGGFWDSPPASSAKAVEKTLEPPKVTEIKPKKKTPVMLMPPKKETTPALEFEDWCTTVLASFSSKIDVPTFVGFLRDIESPYEVKDYVKCYLGESKDSSDFARQFLERRSKLLRVGMVTPSDDLCSPAMAVNPRTISGSDYQEGKGKKTKKNKMLKVDARILGFSVTAAQDRINIGDIDTA